MDVLHRGDSSAVFVTLIISGSPIYCALVGEKMCITLMKFVLKFFVRQQISFMMKFTAIISTIGLRDQPPCFPS